jgi:hypothetical protein
MCPIFKLIFGEKSFLLKASKVDKGMLDCEKGGAEKKMALKNFCLSGTG